MLTIGNITIDPPLILAPMAGISDLAYRMVNRARGCPFAFTEMISSSALVHTNRNTLKLLSTTENDRPLGIQLLGADEDIIKQAVDIVSEYKFDIIDFNAACPAGKVVSSGKGAALLKNPDKLQRLLEVIVQSAAVPVTVKIRAGWDDTSVNAVETARRARDAGVSAVFIHGRTKAQGYRGSVDYDVVRSVKEAVDIPVVASGDALTPELISRMFSETGCDGVFLARGVLGNPWLFGRTVAYLKNGAAPDRPGAAEVARTMKSHFEALIALRGETIGVIHFRKFFAWYTKGLPARELKVQAFHATTESEMLRLINELEHMSGRAGAVAL